MKNIIRCSLLISCLLYKTAIGQLAVTNQKDTSFNTYNEFTKLKKSYPEISIVNEFDLKTVSRKRNITYNKLGKRKLKLDAFYPKKKTDTPMVAVIFIHGGGWRSGDRSQHYPLAQKLADLGYVCFTPEYRLSTEALFPAAVYDIKAVIRWVRKHAKKYNIDTAKIVIAGFSAGGELAAFMGVTGNMPLFEGVNCNMIMQSRVAAIIDIDGTLSFVHPESGEGDDSKKISAATNWFGYSKQDNLKLWEDASPLSYVGKNTPPTLFINSSVVRMHAGREDYLKILTDNNIYSEVRTFENSPHSFCLYNPWFEPTVNYIDTFLKNVFTRKYQ
ncbi:alpha/beta hydrolase fold domain-containing protein [Ferruginibacter sp. SUN002]|uniref:alpha/beta hydrolase fold domain-containing protein n=1 Tax=Ferruginibacter sp. SUN002 TaxID=2937789 RepID=UPI003D36E538